MAKAGLLKYHILGTLWVGQSSILHRATDPHNRVVAVKMLLPGVASGRQAMRMMEREARVALKLDHPNIVKAIEFVRSAPMPALVMEYFESENLKTYIVRSPEFIHKHAKRIMLQICEAMTYLHDRGIVHLDMKPENVLVGPDGVTKIIDFALSEPVRRRWLSLFSRRKIAGTRPYIAPETIRRQSPDRRTDIYSLGVTIYEMLAGRPPFVSEDRNSLLRMHLSELPISIRSYNPNVSLRMDELVLSMLSKSPDRRPENLEEVALRLQDIAVFDK